MSQRASVLRRALLDLQGGVMDREAFFQFMHGAAHERVAGVSRRDDQMDRERGFHGAHFPDVEIVDGGQAGQACQEAFDGSRVDVGRHGGQGEAEGFAQQPPRAGDDDGDDRQADSRVEPRSCSMAGPLSAV